MSEERRTKKPRNHPDVVMAHAQIALTFVLLVAIIGLVTALIFGHNSMTDRTFSMISGTVVSLVTLLTLSWNYFFARQRAETLPDKPPNNNGTNNAPISTGGTVSVSRDDAHSSPAGLG